MSTLSQFWSSSEPTESISTDKSTMTDTGAADESELQSTEISPNDNLREPLTENLVSEPNNAVNSNETQNTGVASGNSSISSSLESVPRFNTEQTPVDHKLNTVTHCVSGGFPEGSLDIAANWEVGESRIIELVRRQTQMQEAVPALTITSSTLIRVSVLSETENGYQMEWLYGDTALNGPSQFLEFLPLNEIANLTSGMRVLYEIERDGAFNGLLNIDELLTYQERTVALLQQGSEDSPVGDLLTTVVSSILTSVNRDPVYQEFAFAEDILTYHTLHGNRLALDVPVQIQTRAPNPFNNDAIRYDTEIMLVIQNPEAKCGVVQITSQSDSVEFTELATGVAEQIAAQFNVEIPDGALDADVLDQLALSIQDTSYFTIDTQDGWIQSIENERVIRNLNEIGAVVRLSIMDRTNEPNLAAFFYSKPSVSNDGRFIAKVILNANLRDGPGTTFERIGGAQIGERLTVVRATDNEQWYQLESGAWIAAFLIEKTDEPIRARSTPPQEQIAATTERGANNTTTNQVQIDSEVQAALPITPTLTELGHPVLSDLEKDPAIQSLLNQPGVQDAIIVQDEATLTLLIGVNDATNAENARQLGNQFVRLVKAYSVVEPDPANEIGIGIYDYVIFVTTLDGKDLAFGNKSKADIAISW